MSNKPLVKYRQNQTKTMKSVLNKEADRSLSHSTLHLKSSMDGGIQVEHWERKPVYMIFSLATSVCVGSENLNLNIN